MIFRRWSWAIILLIQSSAYAIPITHSLTEKLVDNRGKGDPTLYGVRNFRMVFPGVLYRGGANNKYLTEGKRDTHNPLPDVALENLCKTGFDRAVYLYDVGFATAKKEMDCEENGKRRKLTYSQISPFSRTGQYELLKMVFDGVKQRDSGAMYAHCWNGWHASGFISALALRQFCGIGANQAWKYWVTNTDGYQDIKGAKKLKREIEEFKPYKDLAISRDEKRQICGDLK